MVWLPNIRDLQYYERQCIETTASTSQAEASQHQTLPAEASIGRNKHKPYLAISFLQGVQAADQASQNLWFACHRWLCPCKKLLAYVDCYLPGSPGS